MSGEQDKEPVEAEVREDQAAESPEVEEQTGNSGANEESVAAESDESSSVEEVLSQLQAENTALKEQVLRVRAEAENSRKRMQRQRDEDRKYQNQDILRDLTDTIDNFERAIASSVESRDFETFHEGIVMIEKQFSGMLAEKYSLEKVGMEGEVFDPSSHEALMLEESADVQEDTVAQVFQTGYRLHERILRPAKVKVAKPAAPVVDNSEKESEEQGA